MKKLLKALFMLLGVYFLILYPTFYIFKHHIRFGFQNKAFYIKNLSIGFDGKHISINTINIYRNGLSLKDLFYESKPLFFYTKYSQVYIKNKKIHAFVDGLNIVLVAQDNKPSKIPNFNIKLYEKYYKHFDVRVDSLYIESADRFSNNAFALLIPKIYLKNGILYTKDYAHFVYMSTHSRHELYVFIPKAYLKNGYFIAKNVNAVSSLYDFNLNFWWSNRLGHILASGFLMPIKTPVFDTSTSYGNIKAFINNKDIHYKGDFNIKTINIPKLKPLENLSFSLTGYANDSKAGFDSILSNNKILADINYKDKNNDFNIKIQKLNLTNKDLNINVPIFIKAGGDVFYSIDKQLLKINVKTSYAKLYTWLFNIGYIKGILDFSKKQAGVLKYAFYGEQSIKGNILFSHKNIQTRLYTNNLSFSKNNISFNTNGFLEAMLYPKFYAQGILQVKNIKAPFVDIARMPVNLSYQDGTLNLVSNSNILDGFLTYKNNSLIANIKPKNITLYKLIDNKFYIINLKSGLIVFENNYFSANNVSFIASNTKSNFFSTGYLNASGKLNNFSGNIYIDNLKYGFLKDVNGSVAFFYKNKDIKLFPTLRQNNFLMASNINISKSTNFNIHIKGSNKFISSDLNITGDINTFDNVKIDGFIVYKKENIKIPVLAYMENKNGIYNLYAKGFHVKIGNVNINVDNIVGNSSSKNIIKWHTNGAKVFLYEQPIFSIDNINGILSLKPFYIKSDKTHISNLLNGIVYFGYDKHFYIQSNGFVDIDDTLAFMKSKLPFILKGKINYEANIDDNNIYIYLKSQKPIMLLSKYISLPLYADINDKININQEKDYKPINIVFDSQDKRHYINLSIDYNNNIMNANANIKSIPIYYNTKNWYYQGFLDGTIKAYYTYKPNKSLNVNGNIYPGGLVYIKTLYSEYYPSPSFNIPKYINMHFNFQNKTPINIMLPEGNIYANVKGKAFTKKGHFDYNFDIMALGGELRYSQKDFYVRTGELKASTYKKYVNLLIMSPGDSYNTYISLNGNLDNPHFSIYSQPPISTQQLLSSFILNQSGLTAIPINELALKASKYSPSGIVNKIFGTNVNLSVYPSQSANGNLNTNMEVQKKLTKNISLKAHISTSQNPLDTYYNGSLKLTPNTHLDFEMYGNGSSQGSISYEKHFDIGK